MNRPLRSTAALLLWLTLASCATVGPEATAPEPRGEEVTHWARSASGGHPVHIYMRNNTQRTLVLTEFELYNCLNVLNTCRRTYPDLVLPPGEIVRVETIRKRDRGERHRYSYRYNWSTYRGESYPR